MNKQYNLPGSPATTISSMRNTGLHYFATESGSRVQEPIKNYETLKSKKTSMFKNVNSLGKDLVIPT